LDGFEDGDGTFDDVKSSFCEVEGLTFVDDVADVFPFDEGKAEAWPFEATEVDGRPFDKGKAEVRPWVDANDGFLDDGKASEDEAECPFVKDDE